MKTMSAVESHRHRTVRRTGKPHFFTEDGERLVLERTAPGEWWLSRADYVSRAVACDLKRGADKLEMLYGRR